ncbi:MAG: NAD(FAD)-utilizing dehydrogenase, partial [Firmicutes bacterium]|nr:NAD(FAD)-utilizing dehydrogenase [Bacillota bacterium]
IKDPRIAKVLEEFVLAGANEDIKYRHKPHIGTDVLRGVVVNIRKKIESLGGEVIFDARLDDIRFEGQGTARKLKSVSYVKKGEPEETEITTDCLILAIGHSARDTFRMLFEKGIDMQQKPFSIGLRIRHPQELINEAQYGKNWREMGLPPAEYKLSYHSKETGRGVYTFCMCPGGEVIAASSAKGCTVTNGMSYHARDGEFANSALLVDVRVSDFGSDHPLAGVEFQEKYEHIAYKNGANYKPPTCTWGEFSSGSEIGAKVRECLPTFAAESMMEAMPFMARRLRGFDDRDAMLFAVESRSSSPVRIVRNEEMTASAAGIYPGGEGAGYAGGIVSAAVDGIKLAEAVISRYAKFVEE